MKPLHYISTKDASGHKFPGRQKMLEELAALPPGRYDWTIEKHKKKKSLSQLGYYFAVVLPMFRDFALEQGWEFESIEEVDIYLKSLFADREIANKHTGEMIKIPALKRNMTTSEFSTYVNQVRDWCSEFLGGYIPEPNEQTNINFSENSLQDSKE